MNNSKKFEVFELYSVNGVHSTFLNGLARNIHPYISRFVADRHAIDSDPEASYQVCHLKVPRNRVQRELFFAFTALSKVVNRRMPLLITGASVVTHLVLAAFLSPDRAAVVIHSEFARGARLASFGDWLCRLSINLYRRRNIRLIVLSKTAATAIVDAGLFPRQRLHVITHPLLSPELPARTGRIERAALIGLIRKQKLAHAEIELPKIVQKYKFSLAIFGKVHGFDVEKLEELFEIRQLMPGRYTDEEEKAFIQNCAIGALLFLPGREYRYTTSGVVCDATRLGCYVVGPESCDLAIELIGGLYNPPGVRLDFPSHHRLLSMVARRAQRNRGEIAELVAQLGIDTVASK